MPATMKSARSGNGHASTSKEAAVQPLPAQSHGRRPAERYAEGKALRHKVARSLRGTWKAAAERADPIALLERSGEGRLPELLPLRYGRMLVSPFTFFRGAAAVMAADLAALPTSGMMVQACGDCHLLNFGGFATAERKVIFDINDFDETAVAPWEWDVERLAASFVVAGRDRGFKRSECREAAWRVGDAYRGRVVDLSTMSTLEAWYDTIDLGAELDLMTDREMRRYYRNKLSKATEKDNHAREFAKLAFLEGERPRIKDDPPLIYHPTDKSQVQQMDEVERALQRYLETLTPDRRVLLERFRPTDAAMKIVGVGSVGTFCGVVLLMSGKGDPLFLQFKEARASVLEPYAGRSPYPNHGQRVVVGQRLMQAASDLFLGWTQGDEGRHFYVRQLKDVKIKPALEIMNPSHLAQYGAACGRALARAHSRSLDVVMLSGYLGKSDAFADAITRFAEAYADQTERDHEKLGAAVRSGRIEAAAVR
jgi:uncharacterized protein (DUF2252 family)